MKQRVTAILVSLALVVGAVYLRSVLHDDNSSTGSAGHGGGTPVVACTPDLEAICDALAAEGKIVTGTPTLDLARAADPATIKDLDGWITWDPAPQIANLDAPDTWPAVDQIASADAGIMLTTDDRALLPGTCSTSLKWSCVALAPGDADSGLSVGVGEPTTADGLARLAPLAPSFARGGDPTDVDIARARSVLDSPAGGQDDAATMGRQLVTAPGLVNIVVGPTGLLDAAAASTQGRNRDLTVLTPAPAISMGIVLATRGDRDLGSVGDAATNGDAEEALVAIGLTPGSGKLLGDDVAGALWQLRKKVG